MMRAPLMILLGLLVSRPGFALPSYHEIDQAPHHYWQRTPKDHFTRLKDDLESGRIALDKSSEKAFVASLLKALEVPATSQLLVFSTTSLQLSRISTSNPRALYFNEDLYVGYVPGLRSPHTPVQASLQLHDLQRGVPRSADGNESAGISAVEKGLSAGKAGPRLCLPAGCREGGAANDSDGNIA